MQQYNIRVTNTAKVALTLILTPLTVTPLIFIGAMYGPPMPDWAVVTSIFVLLCMAIAFTVFMVKKISPKGIITLQDDGFRVHFPERSMFTPEPFDIQMSQVKNFFAEGKNELYYLSFTTNTQPHKFNIEARSKNDEDLASFTELMGRMARMVERNNEVHGNDTQTIAHVSMYEKTWAKILSVCVILIVGWVLYMKLFTPEEQTPSWWRLSTVFIFGVPFLHQVYYYNYGKGKRKTM